MTLTEQQRLFWRCVRFDPAPEELEQVFGHGAALAARDRMAIYRRMYWYRQVDALWDGFPRLGAALGERRFVELASAYIAAHPSEHPALERFGRKMPDYLRGQAAFARAEADLAELEWHATLALLAADPPAGATTASVNPATFAGARLAFTPSLQRCRVAVQALALFDQGSEQGAKAGEVTVALWRPRFGVHHAALRDDEAGALARACAGATVAEACEVFADGDVSRAREVIGGWFEREWIVEVRS